MRVTRWMRVLGAVVLACAAACGGTSPTKPTGTEPRITSLTPGQVIQSEAPQTVTVTGTNFASGLSATLIEPSGVAHVFTGGDIQAFQSTSFQIMAVFAASGTYTLQVKNSTGGVSDPFAFAVQSQSAGTSPQITSVSPGSTLHSNSAQFLTINGAQFAPALTVTLIDPTGQPTQLIGAIVGVVTPTQFQILVTLPRVGTYSLFVTNPTGEISNSVSIPVL